MLNAQQAEEAVRNLPRASELPVKERAAVREANKVAEAEITEQFKQWLASEYPESGGEEWNSAIHDVIWDKAWSDGHHAGYHEVGNHYESLADFIVKCTTSNRDCP